MRGILYFFCAVGGLAACNMITGANDLTVCTDNASCKLAATSSSGGTSGASGSSGAAPIDGGTRDAGGNYVPPPPLPTTCTDGQTGCDGRQAAICKGATWQKTPCAEACADGQCAPWPSCRPDLRCGNDSVSCCASGAVTGGEFNRLNSSGLPAKVSPFQLDLFEVTVARFRVFVEAGAGTQASPPPAGASAHPGANLPYSGWQSSWNGLLPDSSDTLKNVISGGTWTASPGDNESRPITSVPWLVAFAFCAWDGGRLPTLAEWSFAASNGSEQRLYPWSSPPSDSKIDVSFAAYNCAVADPAYSCPLVCSAGAYSCTNSDCTNALGTCSPGPCIGCNAPDDIAKVGTRPAGKGNFGQFDMSGNAAEFVLDAMAPGGSLPATCTDCALLMGPNPAGPLANPSDDWEVFVLNGGWSAAESEVQNSVSNKHRFNKPDNTIGFRCARD